jgi:hypothetical protein
MKLEFQSAKFDEVQQKEPCPERLFHYTTQSGLLDILDSGALWATKIQYLNDSTEFGLAVELAKRRLEKRIEACNAIATTDVGVEVLQVVLTNLHGITNSNICSVSFCKNGDLLSQWRGYASNGVGYSIGFQTDALVRKTTILGCRLSRCIYDEETQIIIVDDLIDKSMQVVRDMMNSLGQENRDSCIRGVAATLERSIVKYGACFKHVTFKEENEWRLITNPISFTDKNFRFRQGLSTIKPYYILKLVDEIDVDGLKINGPWFNMIEKIVIGPCPHPKLSEQSILGLIIKYFINDGRDAMYTDYHMRLMNYVVTSTIPFRNW